MLFPALYFFSLPFELHLLPLNSVFAALSSFLRKLETIDKQTHHTNSSCKKGKTTSYHCFCL